MEAQSTACCTVVQATHSKHSAIRLSIETISVKCGLLIAVLLLMLSPANVYGQGQSLNVNGPDTLCVGEDGTYSLSTGGWTSYHWSATGTHQGSSPDSATFTLHWLESGTFTVAVVVTSSQGGLSSYNKQVTVLPAPEPFVTTNFDSYCGTITGEGRTYSFEKGECFTACAHTTVMYYANGWAGSTFSWKVVGAVSSTDYGDSLEVTWGGPGRYVIELIEYSADSCAGIVKVCIDIVGNPVASIASLPPATNDTIYICLNQEVYVSSTSHAGNGPPISNTYWHFGNGTVATGMQATHRYTQSGTYALALVVENECRCTDTAWVYVVVSDLVGVDIHCPGLVCPGDTVIYYTTATCSKYNWTVTGGDTSTAINTNGVRDSIRVIWGNPANGLGTISLDGSLCGADCPLPNIITIPVITDGLPITGPDTVCQFDYVQYLLHPVPGATYTWTLDPPTAGGLYVPDTLNEAWVIWYGSPGTATLRVQYDHEFLGCGGESSLEIVIQEKFTLEAEDMFCENDSVNFSVTQSAGTWAWEITNASGTAVYPKTVGTSALSFFPWPYGPGDFRVRIYDDGGHYCLAYIDHHFRIHPVPAPPSAISGPAFICPGAIATYTAVAASADYYLEWEVTGGSPATAGGSHIEVLWNTTGPWHIAVRQVQRHSPGCASDTIRLTVQPRSITDPQVFGPDTVCVNSLATYFTDIPDAYRYEWSVLANTMGSVASGQDSDTATIQWNNSPGNATVRLRTTVCGQLRTGTKEVYLTAQLAATINAPDSVCTGDPVVFSATNGTWYTWDFGDGTILDTSGNPVNHTYTKDSTFAVTVRIANPDGCTDTATATHIVFVKPSPVANITTPDDTLFCLPDTVNATLYASVQELSGIIYSYQWYVVGNNNVLGTGKTYHATQPGIYYAVVTDLYNGCSTVTNAITLVELLCPGVSSCIVKDSIDFTWAIDSPHCSHVAFTPHLGSNGRVVLWSVTDPASGNPVYTDIYPEHTFSASGYYRVSLTARFPEYGGGARDSCDTTITRVVTIPIFADFVWEFACGPADSFDVRFIDQSDYVDNHTINSWRWYVNGTELTAHRDEEDFRTPLKAGATYTVTLAIESSTGHACQITHTLTVPQKPQAAFTGPAQTCVGIPAHFTNLSTGNIVDFLWDFKDGATLRKWDGVRVYSNDDNYSVTLHITDKYGCPDSAVQQVVVHGNPLGSGQGGINVSNGPYCIGDTVYMNWFAPFGYDTTQFTYLWPHDGGLYASNRAYFSGNYLIYVTDNNGCWDKYQAPPIHFQSVPVPAIIGKRHYCIGETIQLSANTGSQYQYWWLPSGTFSGHNGPELSWYPSQPGIYPFRVALTDPVTGCSDTSAVYEVTVHALPDTPVVVSTLTPACEGLQVLTATSQGAVQYNWSTGHSGPSAPVYAQGIYAVTAVDTFGCKSTGFFEVHPGPAFEHLLTGCYEVCDTTLPDTIPGLPGVFDSFTWYRNGQPVYQGSGTMGPLPLPGPGSYHLVATTDSGCSGTSSPLDLTIRPCGPFVPCDWFTIDSMYIDTCLVNGDTIAYFLKVTTSNTLGRPVKPYMATNQAGNDTAHVPTWIFPGTTTFTAYYFDLAGDDSLLCLMIGVIDTVTNDTCYSTYCIPLPGCGGESCCDSLAVASAIAICDTTYQSADSVLHQVTVELQNGCTQDYVVVGTASSSGTVMAGGPDTLAPGTTPYTFGLRHTRPSPDSACITLTLVGTQLGDTCLVAFCVALDTCPPPHCCDSLQISLAEVHCDSAKTTADTAEYYIRVQVDNACDQGYTVIATLSDTGTTQLTHTDSIPPGSTHTTLSLRVPQPAPDSACVALVLVGNTFGDTCTLWLCLPLPPCDTLPGPTNCPEFDFELDSLLCLGSMGAMGENQYRFRLQMYNPSGIPWEIHVFPLEGTLDNIKPVYAAPNTSTPLWGVFGQSSPLIDSLCLVIKAIDTATGLICTYYFCYPLPPCPATDTCNVQWDPLRFTCLGTDSTGRSLYSVSIGGNNLGGPSTVVLQSQQGTMVHYAPRQVPSGPFQITGTMAGPANDTICIDVVLIDSATGAVCRKTLCAFAECYDPPLDTCSGITAYMDTLRCDTPSVGGYMTIYWKIAISGATGVRYVHAYPSAGTIVHVQPQPITGAGHVAGYAIKVPDTTTWLCVDLVLIDTAMSTVCTLQVCDSIDCSGYYNKRYGDEGATLPLDDHGGALLAYPNPTTGAFTVAWHSMPDGLHRLAVYDVHGRPVYGTEVAGPEGHRQVAAAHWPAGLYVVRLYGADGHIRAQKVALIR